MRIVIATAQGVFAEALTSLLKIAGHDIVGCAADLGAAAGIIDREQVDACVLDLGLPGTGQLSCLERVVSRSPRTA